MTPYAPPADTAVHKCRVLIVENDAQYCEDAVANLTSWGYQTYVAIGRGPTLLQDAIEQAGRHRCHLALVDMRLVDDYDHQDTSGLDLVVKLKPTESIIVSSFGDWQRAVEAINQKRALTFIGKEKGPNKLREVLDQIAGEHCRSDLRIKWYPAYEPAQILTKLRLSDPTIPGDEPEDLFRRLYALRDGQAGAAVVQLELKPVSAHYRSTEEAAPLERSIVFVARPIGANHHPQQPEIVKIALVDQIRNEIDHYRDHVERYLPPDRTARIEDSKNAFVLWDIGAIRYTNIATADRRPLRQWYAKATARKLEAALRDLLSHTLKPWYQMSTLKSANNVYEHYVTTFVKLGPRIAGYPDQSEFVNVPGVPYALRNPAVWAHRHASQSRFMSKWAAYIHGDLHSDNIFVDQRTLATCVIDYERSGPGYVLRDFAELETDIRLRLVPFGPNDLLLAHQLDMLLLTPEHGEDELEWPDDLPDGTAQTMNEAHKAFDTICALRRLAAQYAPIESMDEYYWALLMETMISVVRQVQEWDDEAVALFAKQRAFVAASALAERLAHWGRSWPPDHMRANTPPVAADNATQYNPGVVRQLFVEAITDQELIDLCQDHYPEVYNQFTNGQDRSQHISRLIEYCDRRRRMGELLQHIKHLNPVQYARFEGRLSLGEER